MEAETKQRQEMEARMEEMILQRIEAEWQRIEEENRYENEPNVPIHAEFCIEYGSTFNTATDAIPSTSATHNYSCELLDTLYCRLNTLT